MVNSFELLDILIKKPLYAVIGLLMGTSVWLFMFAMHADIVHAEIAKDQEITEKYQVQQDVILELVIRIDENVKQFNTK